MSPSSVAKQTEESLDEVLRIIREEYEGPYPVLCEADRNRFVREEESLRERLRETMESDSSNWRRLLCLPSPQAERCLENAQELRQRVKGDINTRLRTRFTGKIHPFPSRYGQDPAVNSTGARMPETDAPLVEDNTKPTHAIITSPLNMRCSLQVSEPEASEVSGSLVAPDINSETSSESIDQNHDPSSRPRRRPPPPPPGRIFLSSNSSLTSETSSHSGSDSPRRSRSVRRPAPSPPQSPRQSRIFRGPSNTLIPPHTPLSSDSIAEITQQITSLASSLTQGLSMQAQGRQGARRNEFVSKTNCLDITGSHVNGVTMNNGGTKNSGAVIHTTNVPSPRLPQPVRPL